MLFRSWAQVADPAWPDVARVPDHVGGTHLLVTRHALVRQVLADPVTYRPDNALDAVTPMPVTALRVLAGHRFRLPPTLANNSGVSHPQIRAIVAEALHPARVAAQRQWLTELVRDRVARIGATLDTGAPVDLYADLAADLPLLVLARLVELPDAPVGAVKDFARAALELFWAPLDADRQVALAAEVGRFHRVLRDFAAVGGGLAADLRAAGHPPDVVVGALFFLLVAGQETTTVPHPAAAPAGRRARGTGRPAHRRDRGGRRGGGGTAAGTTDRHLAAGGDDGEHARWHGGAGGQQPRAVAGPRRSGPGGRGVAGRVPSGPAWITPTPGVRGGRAPLRRGRAGPHGGGSGGGRGRAAAGRGDGAPPALVPRQSHLPDAGRVRGQTLPGTPG